MSENNCDAAIQRNNRIQEQVFRQTLEQGLQGTPIGNFQSLGNNLQQQNNRIFDGTGNRDERYFDQSLWDYWKNDWYGNTRETFDNIKTMNYLDQAINARHKALRGITSPNFDTDCNSNVAKVMEEFKKKELNDFVKLNSYMSSLLTSYKHLFDYKSSIKAIYNELNPDWKKLKITKVKDLKFKEPDGGSDVETRS